MLMSSCMHKWNYLGLVYRESEFRLPGSSARERVYADRFYCEHCAEFLDKNERAIGNTYEKPIAGATPK